MTVDRSRRPGFIYDANKFRRFSKTSKISSKLRNDSRKCSKLFRDRRRVCAVAVKYYVRSSVLFGACQQISKVFAKIRKKTTCLFASKRFRMYPNASECIQLGPNESEWVQTSPKTSKNFRKLQFFASLFQTIRDRGDNFS